MKGKPTIEEAAMAQSFSVEATVARPAPQVWSALTDWEKAHQWMAGVEWIKADGDTGVGTRLTFHARGKDRTAEISSYEDGRSVVLRSVQGGVTADYTYALEPQGDDSTRVTLVADCRSEGLIWNLLSPLVRLAMRMADRGQLKALKGVVEKPD